VSLPEAATARPRSDAVASPQTITKLGDSWRPDTATSASSRHVHRLLPPIKLAWIQRLRALGVSAQSLAEPELPACEDVVLIDGHFFDFADEAHGGQSSESMLFLARDDLGDPRDIVAWEPRAKRVAGWWGTLPLLGMEQLLAPRLDRHGALRVFADPLEWLLHERNGVVIVNPVAAAPLLRAAEPLEANPAAFGRRLAELINPRPPRIVVPNRRAA
jgi:hypothetical protein